MEGWRSSVGPTRLTRERTIEISKWDSDPN